MFPELKSWGFRLLGGNSGKLGLRPLWEKNPAALWIIKGFSGPSGEGSGGGWVPGCQWSSHPTAAGNPEARKRAANSKNMDVHSEGGGNRFLLLSTLQPLSSASQWRNLTEKQQAKESGKCNLQSPWPRTTDMDKRLDSLLRDNRFFKNQTSWHVRPCVIRIRKMM